MGDNLVNVIDGRRLWSAETCNFQKENYGQHLGEAVNPVQSTKKVESKLNSETCSVCMHIKDN
jgi:hypothetical protein